jgi:endonuclease-3 related protein
VLTQNTAWKNVERAIQRLERADMLTLAAIHAADHAALASTVQPAGTYRVKARRLKALAAWIHETHGGDLDVMFAGDPASLRKGLLSVSGVGPETADAIMLYAGGIPTFVVDAYTRRVLRRHLLLDGKTDYAHARDLFEKHIPPDAAVYGEYHALLVELGKRYCRTTARCDECPLRDWPHEAQR